MSQRSFPPSFWNSNYQPPKCHSVGGGVGVAGGSGSNNVPPLNYGASGSHASMAAHGHASAHPHDLFSQAEAYHAHAAALHANHHAHHAAAHHAHHLTHAQSDAWHYSLSSQVCFALPARENSKLYAYHEYLIYN